MKRLTCLLLACLTALALTSCGAAKTQELSLFAMDTYMTLSAVGDGAADALARASQEINALEAALSRTIDTSDVSRLNRDGSAVWSQDSAGLLALARQYSAETDGAFDVTVAPLVELWAITSDAPHVPTQAEIDALLPLVGTEHIHQDGTAVSLDAGCAIDLGGIAKGYASDRVAAILAASGVTGGCVSLGGNVYVCGMNPQGKPWSVAIQDPENSGGYACLLRLTDAFAVTSGGYQRYFVAEDGTVYQHILDPKTGAPAQSDLTSVTVITYGAQGHQGTMADAYSTALYVMGEQAASDFWRAHADRFDMILITADGRLLYTSGLADILTKPEGSAYDFQLLTTEPAA